MKFFVFLSVGLVVFNTYPTTVWAEDAVELSEIHITGRKTPQSGVRLDSGSKSVLYNSDLQSVRAISLGQTVEKISGVHNNSFGPNNGLPQIRSLTGSRVYLMQNGLGISDMAGISGNLPSAVEPFLADKITVQKSSAAVLYGGHAVGGAVQVETGQIPQQLPEKNFGGKGEISGGYNTPTTQLFSLTGKSGQIAWHIDGMNNKISSYRVPGDSKAAICHNRAEINTNYPLTLLCQVSRNYEYFFNQGFYKYVDRNYLLRGKDYLDQYELDISDVYRRDKPSYGNWVENPGYDPSVTEGKGRRLRSIEDVTPNEHGKMANSHMHQQSVSAGVSYIGADGYIGLGVSRYLNRYGVPGYASLSTRAGRKNALSPVNIESSQARWLLDGMYRSQQPWLDNVRFSFAHIDAANRELLGNQFADSLNSQSNQGRLEINYRPIQWWQGVLGGDWTQRRTNGEGVDRYLPDTKTTEYAVFALQKFNWGNWSTDIGARHGRTRQQAILGNYQPGRGLNEGYIKQHNNKMFELNSYQAALKWQPAEGWETDIRYSRSQRAPEVNELFASNRHYAILTNEHGDPRLQPETANTWEFSQQISWRNSRLKVNYYQTRFQDYIYLGQTGTDKGDGLPYKEWRQGDTRIKGMELEVSHHFHLDHYGTLEAKVFVDWVKNSPVFTGKNDSNSSSWDEYVRRKNDGDYMPGLPASRYGASLVWSKGNWMLSSSLTHYLPQKHLGRVINEEISLGGYTIWDMYLNYSHQLGQSAQMEWFLDARNLSNTEARPHNSTLKYLAPLPGRSVRTGVRVSF